MVFLLGLVLELDFRLRNQVHTGGLGGALRDGLPAGPCRVRFPIAESSGDDVLCLPADERSPLDRIPAAELPEPGDVALYPCSAGPPVADIFGRRGAVISRAPLWLIRLAEEFGVNGDVPRFPPAGLSLIMSAVIEPCHGC